MNALRILLEGAIDYAGLFPPASLEMPEVIRNYSAYRDGEDAWALGRFVAPLARLHEVAARPWRFSLLAGVNEVVPSGVADVVEIKAATEEELETAAAGLPAGTTAYFESPEELIPAIAALGARAKIRMGGLIVPEPETVARFMGNCARARIGIKATAGLHHPVRSDEIHGFINVLLAACFAWQGATEALVCDVMEEEDANAFRFDADGVAWRDQYLAATQLADSRDNFIAGFGSCSFEEPLADLRSLGYL